MMNCQNGYPQINACYDECFLYFFKIYFFIFLIFFALSKDSMYVYHFWQTFYWYLDHNQVQWETFDGRNIQLIGKLINPFSKYSIYF